MAREKKLTEKERIAMWRGRIKTAQEKRDAMHEGVWKQNIDAYRGKLKPTPLIWADSDPWVSVELVHSSIRSAVPSLLYNRPKWTITPKKPFFGPDGVDYSWDRADIIDTWLDQVWGETDGNEHVRMAIVSAFLAFGCCKVGYAPTFADDEKRGEFEYDDLDGDVVFKGVDKRTGNPLPVLEKGEFLRDDDGDLIWDEETNLPVLHPGTLQREEFFVEWVPWMSMLFDPEGGNVFRNHRYVIEEWVRPLCHVKKDPRYVAAARNRVTATESLQGDRVGQTRYDSFQGDATLGVVERDNERVRGWDIWDFEEDRLLVLVDGEENDELLMDDMIPEGVDHGPFVFLKFNEDPGEFYPRTDCEGMSKVELEYNWTRSQMATHRNQSRARYFEVPNAGFAGDDGGDLERAKFQSGPSGIIVQVRSQEGVQPARKDALDNSFFTEIPNIRMDFAEVAGQGGEARGVADADTATQASLVAAGADVRNNDRRDNLVQTFLSRIGRKLLQACQAHTEVVKWVKITGNPNAIRPFFFKPINPEDLKGEFDVDVAMGSTQPKNSSNRVAMLTQLTTMLAQNPVIMASPTLMKRLFEAADIKDDVLIQEIMQIGQAALGQMAPPPEEGAEGQTPAGEDAEQGADPNQVVGDIANQFLEQGSPVTGQPTGAPANNRGY